MHDTVILPTDSRSMRGGRFIPPLLLIPFIAYNALALTIFGWRPEGWSTQLFTIPMVSGVAWSVTWSDLILVGGLVCLFFEVIKSILMIMALVDVVAGFTISITGAGRDVTMGG
jgi:hypothetical protein